MRAVSLPVVTSANKLPAQCDPEIFAGNFEDTIVSREQIWFALLMRETWPVKAEAAVQEYTKASDSSAKAYKRGAREPAASILRDLIRSREGYRVLSWIMRESRQEWWLNLERAVRRSNAIDLADNNK